MIFSGVAGLKLHRRPIPLTLGQATLLHYRVKK
jgi:hypothetical protein